MMAPSNLVAMKPKHGEPCNRCGLCCFVALCDPAQYIFRRPETPGPCPALLGTPGNASCGMISAPERFVPVLVMVYGLEETREAARTLINAGEGCDMRINGEENKAYLADQDQKDEARKAKLDHAFNLWTGEL